MKKIIVVIATIALVASIFYLSIPPIRNHACVMKYDVSKYSVFGFGCPKIGQTCELNGDSSCPDCCTLNTISTVYNHALILAIACFILFAVWRIFKNKIKREEIGTIAKTLLFLGIIALVLYFLSKFPFVYHDPFLV